LRPLTFLPLCRTPHNGKKINGRKRFIVTDILGLLLVMVVLSARVQDRDGAKSVLLDTYLRTRVRFVFANDGFAGLWVPETSLRPVVQVIRGRRCGGMIHR
jgi:hypothetical protein